MVPETNVCQPGTGTLSRLGRCLQRISSALQNYTRCVPYWSTLKAGAARIDLDGNVVGQVTLKNEQAAKVKIAKAERRAKAREIEDRQKTPAQSLPRQPPSRRR